jgi:hypothetical protein
MLDAFVAHLQARWGRAWYIQWVDVPAPALRGYVTLVHRRTGRKVDFDLDHEGDGYHLVAGGPDHNGWRARAWWNNSREALNRALIGVLCIPELASRPPTQLSPSARRAISRPRLVSDPCLTMGPITTIGVAIFTPGPPAARRDQRT